jgi:hypothetical protein
MSVNPLLLPTALLLHPETPILAVLAAAAAEEEEEEEIRRTKMPYKPGWMPFAEDRYTLLENYTPPLIATTFLLISMGVLACSCIIIWHITRSIVANIRLCEDYRVPSLKLNFAYSIMRVDTIS